VQIAWLIKIKTSLFSVLSLILSEGPVFSRPFFTLWHNSCKSTVSLVDIFL
jgi:hypothetical protein